VVVFWPHSIAGYISECIDNSHIYLSYVNTNENSADILTKPLPVPTFLRLCSFLGLCDLPQLFPLEEESQVFIHFLFSIHGHLSTFLSTGISIIYHMFLSVTYHFSSWALPSLPISCSLSLFITLPILRLRRSFGYYTQSLNSVIMSCDTHDIFTYTQVLPPSVILSHWLRWVPIYTCTYTLSDSTY
jgi:hypothetical protein